MTFTLDEIILACKNIGYDLKCGACAEVFFTGATLASHEAECSSAGRKDIASSEKVITCMEHPDGNDPRTKRSRTRCGLVVTGGTPVIVSDDDANCINCLARKAGDSGWRRAAENKA